jgi:putative addiction module killer protein
MKAVLETDEYAVWIDCLRDKRAQIKIAVRVRRLSAGNPGDFKNLGDKVMEMEIDYGPGYRVYYTEMGDVVIVLLVGGDKRSQTKDIEKAKLLAQQVRSDGL